MQIYCDFDGTITLQDTVQLVLSCLADQAWLDVEREWEAGMIGSAECMQRQVAMIHATTEQLDNVLDEVEIDPGFLNLVYLCEEADVPLTVVSDGVDHFIRRVLAGHGLMELPIAANRLAILPGGVYQLTSPYALATCASAAGTCKCAVVNAATQPENTVYIGDGRSDFCVAGTNLRVFAKGRLAEHCAANKIGFTRYKTLNDIIPFLRDLLVGDRAANAA